MWSCTACVVRGILQWLRHHCVPNTYGVLQYVHTQFLPYARLRALALGRVYSVCRGQSKYLAAMMYLVALEFKLVVVARDEVRELCSDGRVRKILADVWCPEIVGAKATYRTEVDVVLKINPDYGRRRG